MPCTAGGDPVVSEVRAVAVVVGTTEVIGPPAAPASVGRRRPDACSCSQPSPSSTSRTTWRAPRTGSGTHAGDGAVPGQRAPSRAGTTEVRQAPP